MKQLIVFCLFLCFVIGAFRTAKPQEKKTEEITKTFSKKDAINMNFTSGDCKVVKSSDGNINVTVSYKINKNSSFEPEMEEIGNTLTLNENFYGKSSGDIKWNISVPAGVKISFNSASGDFQLNNISTELIINTASGDVTIENYSGNMKTNTASGDIIMNNSDGILTVNSASGDVTLNNSKGVFKISTSSGNILASSITLTDKSSFYATSGNATVKLSESPEFDLSVNTTSGDAEINYNGNPISGHFELSVERNSGEINTPFTNETDANEKHGKTFRIITIEKETPVIKMYSASGNLTIKK
jgi:hypothetical protein